MTTVLQDVFDKAFESSSHDAEAAIAGYHSVLQAPGSTEEDLRVKEAAVHRLADLLTAQK